MAYKLVIPCSDFIKSINRRNYILSEDIASLSQQEAQAVLYFSRQSRYTPIVDFPVKGGWKKVSQHSIIEGPMEQGPDTPPPVDTYEQSKEVNIIRLVPVSKLPPKLNPIEFLEYGTALDVERQKYINFMYASGLGPLTLDAFRFSTERLAEIAEEAVKRLKTKFSVTAEEGESFKMYRAMDGESVLELAVGLGNTYHYYPNVNLRAFGPAETTSCYIAKLGLDRLEEVFTTKDAQEVGLENSLRRGFMLEKKEYTKIPSEFEENIVV